MPHLRRFWKGRSDSPAASRAPLGPVFVSHSSRNKKLAEAVVTELESNGIRCWVAPRDIRPGEPNYGAAILDGLDSCRAMVLLLTEPSNASQHVMKESERAVNRKLPILVVRFQPIEVSRELEYYVSSAQFLDATTEPPKGHFPVIRDRVLEMVTNPLRSRRKGPIPAPPDRNTLGSLRRDLVLVCLAIAATAALFLSGFVSIRVPWATPIPADNASSDAAVARTPNAEEAGPRANQGDAGLPVVPKTDVKPVFSGRAIVESTGRNVKAAWDALGGMKDRVLPASRINPAAISSLTDFHRKVLLVSQGGVLDRGDASATDVELRTTFRIHPNMTAYSALAGTLLEQLEKVSAKRGVIISDGLRTSARSGGESQPYIEALSANAFAGDGSLLEIFASDRVRRYVKQDALEKRSPYVTGPNLFLIHDEQATGEDYASGVSVLVNAWETLLEEDGTGIVVVLDSARDAFRHTEWRWFHLSATDWAAISSRMPISFDCRISLEDSAGAEIGRDEYAFNHWGGRVLRIANPRVVVIAPFFVSPFLAWYVPEITLGKTFVVPSDQAASVEGFTVSIQEHDEG